MQDILDQIYEASLGEEESSEGIMVLFRYVDDLLCEGEFSTVDLFLQEIDFERLNSTLCVGVLSITFAAREHLPNRPGAFERALARLEFLVPDRAYRLLRFRA